jgi:hypothetical protein
LFFLPLTEELSLNPSAVVLLRNLIFGSADDKTRYLRSGTCAIDLVSLVTPLIDILQAKKVDISSALFQPENLAVVFSFLLRTSRAPLPDPCHVVKELLPALVPQEIAHFIGLRSSVDKVFLLSQVLRGDRNVLTDDIVGSLLELYPGFSELNVEVVGGISMLKAAKMVCQVAGCLPLPFISFYRWSTLPFFIILMTFLLL